MDATIYWQLSKEKLLYFTLLSISLDSLRVQQIKKVLLPLKIMENNDNDFTCCHCHRMFFNSLNDFRDHDTVAYAYYNVECNLCQNVFSHSADLQTHRQQGRPPPPPAPARQQQEVAHPQDM